jgi:hypothetical protein
MYWRRGGGMFDFDFGIWIYDLGFLVTYLHMRLSAVTSRWKI